MSLETLSLACATCIPSCCEDKIISSSSCCEDTNIGNALSSITVCKEKLSCCDKLSCQDTVPSDTICKESSSCCDKQSCLSDWTKEMTCEERRFIINKIKFAYQRKAPSYAELLDVCCAIEEEFIFMVAPSRLDYIKSGIQFEKRIATKLSCRRKATGSAKCGEISCGPQGQADESMKSLKRAKTQH